MTEIGPETRLCALLGDPVAHSGSPVMHNAAFRHAGVEARYLAFRVRADALAGAVHGLAALDAAGANVTVPHKERALALADEATARAARSGAANVLAFDPAGGVRADNTDGAGFLAALRDAGAGAAGRTVLLLGAGGAARAVGTACLEAGARNVLVANRDPERARRLAAALERERDSVLPLSAGGLRRGLAEADVVVNATPLGLKRDDPSPVATWEGARRGATAVDLVYAPHQTGFVAGARAAGLRAADGRRMLAWQAALSWERWFGRIGPVDVMAGALDRWLRTRAAGP